MAIAYLNGRWMQPEDARVPVFDRGFMFGDGIYEVMAVYNGQVFMREQHLDRLQRSLDAIRLPAPHQREEWQGLIEEAVVRGNENPAYLYLQVTRGLALPRDHSYPNPASPTVLITVTHAPVLERIRVDPLKVVTLEDFRWGRGDIKVTSLVANGLLRNQAREAGYDDAILIRDGEVTEATAANVFIVSGGVIATPPASNFLLHGITRDHVITLAGEAGLPLEQRAITEAELEGADEVWLTSTGQEVWPVGQVNDQLIGGGSAGVVWQTVDSLFRASRADNG